MLKNSVAIVFLATLVVAASVAANDVNSAVGEADLKAAIEAGVERVIKSSTDAHLVSPHGRDELKEAIINQLDQRLLIRLHQFDKALQRSSAVARDFLKSALKFAAMSARWPAEQVDSRLEEMRVQYQAEIGQLLRSVGLLESRSRSASPFMSALDEQSIIEEIIQTLVQDPTFLSLYQWVSSLPAAIHKIADTLFTNKTFGEIGALLKSGGAAALVDQLDKEDDGKLSAPEFRAKDAPFNAAYALVGDALSEVRPLLEQIVGRNQQTLQDHVRQLETAVADFQAKMPFVSRDLIDRVRSISLKFLWLN